MLDMIFKMSLLTLLYVALTAGLKLWVHTNRSKLNLKNRIFIGVIYGFCAILSTHFGVQYDEMALNVRDMAPLAAGLFFDPVSGIIAGLVGGIERFIVGTYFSVGSYTRIACSVSTCLAGVLAALFNLKIFYGKKPSPFYAFSLGAITEVFHMYVVLITHRNDMEMAFYVVNTCAVPMIIFTGLGMFFSSLLLYGFEGKIKSALQKPKNEEMRLNVKFQMWLFGCTLIMLLITFNFSYSLQTRTAIQNAQKTMSINTEDAKTTYKYLKSDYASLIELIKKQNTIMACSVASAVDYFGGVNGASSEGLLKMRDTYRFYEINLIDNNGIVVKSTNPLNIGYDMTLSEQSNAFMDILNGKKDDFAQDFMPTGRDPNISLMYAAAKCTGGMVQVAYDGETIDEYGTPEEYANMFGDRHIGENGVIYVIDSDNNIALGVHKGKNISQLGTIPIENKETISFFTADILGVDSYCRLEYLREGYKFLTVLPLSEVYISRNAALYETGFAEILLFASVFVLIYILIQKTVTDNLYKINKSLTKITKGNLNEVINVRDTREFAALSDYINHTVEALKSYIKQAEERMEEELNFARKIQSAAIPNVFDIPRDEFELFASMNPAKVVGGDFYDFFFVDINKIALVIADVSGKGIPAALFMMRSKTAIKGYAQLRNTPSEIFKLANNALCEENDVNMFVTAWIGIVDLETGVVNCANAGHEYPAVKHKNGEWELLKDKHGIALGVMAGVPYSEYEIQLEEGDRLFVYTDGVPEAINEEEEQFGTERMLESLNKYENTDSTELLHSMREAVASFAGKAEQFDDITMLEFDFKHKVYINETLINLKQ